ncbi:MAG: DUF1178 family protein [Rhodospirillales bacterium]
MILYQLACNNAHQFEAWFRDIATYDAQSGAGDIMCPFCGSTGVTKAPMAPNVATGARKGATSETRAREVAEQIMRAVHRLHRHVEENCEYVGDRFAEEARSIHFGETEERDIYGEATDEEATELDEDGIEFQRIPWTPRRDS